MTTVVNPETTLVIFLGAHEYPRYEDLNSGSFKRSAEEIRSYFIDSHGFGLPEENLLNLFDDPAEPVGIVNRISDFIKIRINSLKQTDHPVGDVIVCYIGHGDFIPGTSEYFLALKSTQKDYPEVSGLQIAVLARVLVECTRHLRLYLILDCCFAAAAFKHFQPTGVSGTFTCRTEECFPEKGVTMLCASSRSTPAETDPHKGYTMFSGALLEVLKNGDIERNDYLSLDQIAEQVRITLNKRYQGKAVRPEIHSPSQKQGDVAGMPLFPNLAAKRKPKAPCFSNIFNYINASQMVLLFSQEGMAQSSWQLLNYAQIRFGPDNVIHLEPLSEISIQPSDYFSDLINQCHHAGSDATPHAFKKCIESQTDNSDKLLLFITRFENTDPVCGTKLANVLRSLVERKRNLNILMTGGERLAALYYDSGHPLSLLTGAHPVYWDELQLEDVQLFCPDMELSGKTSQMLLNISGGHPVLLQECIHYIRKYPDIDESRIEAFIKRTDYLWSRFHNMASDSTINMQLLFLLDQQIVHKYFPLIVLKDPLIRDLFWKNLIKRTEDGKQLVWRSKTIRDAGRLVCANV